MSEIRIIPAKSAADIAAAKALCLAYAEGLGFSLCFQGFDQEMAEFPGKYTATARGALFLATVDGAPKGVVALRDLGDDICEMKRLYVDPTARGLGLGRKLAETLLATGRALGYRAMRLDTLPTMTEARALYRALGFTPIPPYVHNPIQGAAHLECPLAEVEARAATR
ncbi:MAG: GNAT family N-acetyltransferase [Alphaproteobacteria bacterium]|nr:GNAT family N-acetyltransferase [Alphaproteobacteria bacterium]